MLLQQPNWPGTVVANAIADIDRSGNPIAGSTDLNRVTAGLSGSGAPRSTNSLAMCHQTFARRVPNIPVGP